MSNAAYLKEIKALQGRVVESERRLSNFRKLHHKLEAVAEERKRDIKKLAEQLRAEKVKCDNLKKPYHQQIADLEKRVMELDPIKQQLAQAYADLHDAEVQVTALSEQLQDAAKDIADDAETITSLEGQLQEAAEATAYDTQTITKLRKQLDDAGDMRIQFDELKSCLKKSQEARDALLTSLKTKDRLLYEKEATISQLKDRLADGGVSLLYLQKEMSSLTDEYRNKLEEKNESLDTARKNNDTLQARVRKVEFASDTFALLVVLLAIAAGIGWWL